MNFARVFASQLCLLALFALFIHTAYAVDYKVSIIMPRSGGLNDVMYEASVRAAEAAVEDINYAWGNATTGDTFLLDIRDSNSDGATSMSHAFEAMQDNTVLAVVGAGPDNMTLPVAQLLKRADVRFSLFLWYPSLPYLRPLLLPLLSRA